MNKTIKIEKAYINLPVKNGAPRIHVDIFDAKGETLLRYFDIELGDAEYDFIAFYNMGEFIGQELEFRFADATTADKITAHMVQSDAPLGLEGLYAEEHRPQFHFTSRRGWINDPNGLVYTDGTYHLFYQHNPFGIGHGNMHWGHATSPDLIHWEEEDDVLYADTMGTMFSGGAIVDWKNATGLKTGEHPPVLLFYTAAGLTAPEPVGFSQCMAYSTDGGKTFRKYEKNPVVPHIPGTRETRDPKVLYHKPTDSYVMVLYKGNIPEHESWYLIFTSKDMLSWELTQEFRLPSDAECPEFYPIAVEGDAETVKYIFTGASGHYVIGAFDGKRFEMESETYPSYSQSPLGTSRAYAAQTYSDAPDNRRIMVGWQTWGPHTDVTRRLSFYQAMTLPVEITLKAFADGLRLAAEPVKELAAIRQQSFELGGLSGRDLRERLQELPTGNAWDIEVTVEARTQAILAVCGIEVTLDAGSQVTLGASGIGMGLDAIGNELRIGARKIPFHTGAGDARMRILVDSASLEIFSDEGRIWVSEHRLIAPGRIVAWASAGSFKQLDVHTLASIWTG